ncbi:MAG: MFS transporter [Acidimicrobiales bacterium]
MEADTKIRSGYRSALRHRDLRLLLLSNVISSIGSWSYNVALAVFLYDSTHSLAWVAAGSLGRFIPSMVLGPYGGIIAERFERVALMTTLNLAMAALQVGLAIVMWTKAPVVLAIVLAALTSMWGNSAYQPAVQAVVPQVVSEEDLAAANAASGTIDNFVIIAGPAVGAGLLLIGNAGAVAAFNAATFVVAAALVQHMKVRSRPSDVTEGGQASPMRQVARGFQAVVHSPTASLFVAFSVAASFVYGSDTVLFVSISRLQLHTGSTGYGYLLAGLGVGGILGAFAINRIAARPKLATWIIGAMAVYCLPTAALVVVHQPAVGFVLEVVRGAGTLVVDTLAITALQRSVPPEMVARVFGVFFALVLGAMSLGALVAPLVLRAGLHPALLIFGVGVPVLCLLGLPALIGNDRRAATRIALLAPRVAMLERLDLFATASRPALERLAAAAQDLDAAASTVVVAEGDPADNFYVVGEGTLEVTAVGEVGGPPAHLRELGTGSYFGEIGLMAGIPRTATVTAMAPCRLLRISGTDFLAALTDLSASPSMLEGARTRLALTHPSQRSRLDAQAAPAA